MQPRVPGYSKAIPRKCFRSNLSRSIEAVAQQTTAVTYQRPAWQTAERLKQIGDKGRTVRGSKWDSNDQPVLKSIAASIKLQSRIQDMHRQRQEPTPHDPQDPTNYTTTPLTNPNQNGPTSKHQNTRPKPQPTHQNPQTPDTATQLITLSLPEAYG